MSKQANKREKRKTYGTKLALPPPKPINFLPENPPKNDFYNALCIIPPYEPAPLYVCVDSQ